MQRTGGAPRPLATNRPKARYSLMDHSPLPIAELEGPEHIIRYVNGPYCRLVGESEERLVGNPFTATPRVGNIWLGSLDRVYRTGEEETHIESEAAVDRCYLIWPIRDLGQNPTGVMIQVTETGKRHRELVAANEALLLSSVRQHELTEAAEKLNEQLEAGMAKLAAANQALRYSEGRYRTLFDLSPEAVYSCDRSGVITKFNRRATELWGRVPAVGDTDEQFCGSHKMFRPDGSFMPHEQCPMAEVLTGKISETRDAEVLIERPDGSRVTVLVNIRPLTNGDGEIIGAINCFFDISERKRQEEHQRMLLNELSHRVKNMLATVQSIARQTMQSSPAMDVFQEAFEQRLIALAKTHNLLLQNPSQLVRLHDLVDSELAHYTVGDGSRLTIEGDEFSLDAQRVVALGLVLHELATNAVKYGALSIPSGRIEVSWAVRLGTNPTLRIHWAERGGPPVVKPGRRGFGSRLIERGVAYELDAKVDLIFDPAGVQCTIDMPIPPNPAMP